MSVACVRPLQCNQLSILWSENAIFNGTMISNYLKITNTSAIFFSHLCAKAHAEHLAGTNRRLLLIASGDKSFSNNFFFVAPSIRLSFQCRCDFDVSH